MEELPIHRYLNDLPFPNEQRMEKYMEKSMVAIEPYTNGPRKLRVMSIQLENGWLRWL